MRDDTKMPPHPPAARVPPSPQRGEGRGEGAIHQAVDRAATSLMALQRADGHWLFELEADATIPAEYVLLQHYLGEVDDGLQAEIAKFLRAGQADHGGWPLFLGGDLDLSCSVKAYFALKAVGDPEDAPHMQ